MLNTAQEGSLQLACGHGTTNLKFFCLACRHIKRVGRMTVYSTGAPSCPDCQGHMVAADGPTVEVTRVLTLLPTA